MLSYFKLKLLKLIKSGTCTVSVYFSSDINDCVNHTCQNGAPCVDGIDSYSCNCTAGFTGAYCETGKEVKQRNLFLHEFNLLAIIKFRFRNARVPVWFSFYIEACIPHTCASSFHENLLVHKVTAFKEWIKYSARKKRKKNLQLCSGIQWSILWHW